VRVLENVINEARYAVRLMRRAPGFSAAVVTTVTLAIAANTTIFSFANAVLLKPLPFRDPERLVQVAEKNDTLNLPTFGASVLNFLDWRAQSRAFQELAAIGFANYTVTGSGEPEQVSGNRISPALTRVLGIAPVVGRAFRDDEEQPSAAPVAMLGEGLWRRRFGGDASLVGRTLVLNDVPTTIVGVAPAALNLISGGDVYTPLSIDRAKEIRLNHVIFVVGRLRDGVSLRQAQGEMDGISARNGREYPEIRDWGIHLVTMFDTFVSATLKTAILVLVCAVACVLLIACANIANLLLARGAARQREMATRTALGASRLSLLRQLLIESLVLSAGGGALGLLVAAWTVAALNRAIPPNTLPVASVTIDTTVLAFVAGLTLVTGIVFGFAPALRVSRADAQDTLKHGRRSASGGLALRVRSALAAAELALATMLLIGAGLLIQSFVHLERVRVGFDPSDIITFQLSPPAAKYPAASGAPQFYRALLASLQSTPGVRGAAVSSGIPFGAGNYTKHPMITKSPSALPPGTAVPIDWRIVSPGYFGVMGIPLLQGRDFTDADGPTAPPVMIVSQATAKKFFGDANPLGRTLTATANLKTDITIVGVVGDVRSTSLNQESPALYYPSAARVAGLMDVVVRAHAAPEALLPTIRQKVRELDPQLALANVRTLDEWVSTSAAQPRLNGILLGVFSVVALAIAAIGIYGVLAYAVTQRTREIGIRMALGAEPSAVMRMIVSEGMTVGAAGIAAGLVGALALARALDALVYGVDVRDPVTYVGVTAALAVVAMAACALPARRAARVDPIASLRCE